MKIDKKKLLLSLIFTFLALYLLGLILKPLLSDIFISEIVDFILAFLNYILPTIISLFFGDKIYQSVNSAQLLIANIILGMIIALIFNNIIKNKPQLVLVENKKYE